MKTLVLVLIATLLITCYGSPLPLDEETPSELAAQDASRTTVKAESNQESVMVKPTLPCFDVCQKRRELFEKLKKTRKTGTPKKTYLDPKKKGLSRING